MRRPGGPAGLLFPPSAVEGLDVLGIRESLAVPPLLRALCASVFDFLGFGPASSGRRHQADHGPAPERAPQRPHAARTSPAGPGVTPLLSKEKSSCPAWKTSCHWPPATQSKAVTCSLVKSISALARFEMASQLRSRRPARQCPPTSSKAGGGVNARFTCSPRATLIHGMDSSMPRL